MFHGREKKNDQKKKPPSNKKQAKQTQYKEKEDRDEMNFYEKGAFNRPSSSNEISVIHPVKEK